MKYYSTKFKRKEEWRKKLTIPADYSLPKAILDMLLDFVENEHLFETPYHHIRRLDRKLSGEPGPVRWRYNRAMRYLVRRGQAKIEKKGKDVFVKLTQKGKLQGLLNRVKNEHRAEKSWDGKWRLVIWDIPESSHNERNKLRYFLKNLGFFRLQLSVFIRPHPIPKAAVEYLSDTGLIEFIRFLRVDKVDEEKSLLKHFDLKHP